jgi:hypothetical protein
MLYWHISLPVPDCQFSDGSVGSMRYMLPAFHGTMRLSLVWLTRLNHCAVRIWFGTGALDMQDW